jgi:hypothetical protein
MAQLVLTWLCRFEPLKGVPAIANHPKGTTYEYLNYRHVRNAFAKV